MDDPGGEIGEPENLERPGDSLIRVSHYADQTLVTIPPRPLIWPLRILITLHMGSIVFLLVAGVVYLVFHRSIFTGLPDPPAVFSRSGSHIAEYKWDAEVATGWLGSVGFLVTILGLVWIPQIATESLTLDAKGISWHWQGWWRREHFDAAWSDVSEIYLLNRKPEFAPNTLIIQLSNDTQKPIAESTSNSEREWLSALINRVSMRYRGSI